MKTLADIALPDPDAERVRRAHHEAIREIQRLLGSKPTITGSRGGNAALASLLSALAAMGLITDGTTA